MNLKKVVPACGVVAVGLAVLWIAKRPHEAAVVVTVDAGVADVRISIVTLPPAEVMSRLKTETDPAKRRALVDELERAPEAAKYLKQAFDENSDGAVREETLVVAARVASPEATGWLADVAKTEDKFAQRAGAAIGAVSDPKAAGDLVKLATGDAPVLVRANAARGLAQAGKKGEHGAALAQLVADRKQPLRVRQEAALALIKIGDASDVAPLAAALEAAAGDPSTDGEQLRISILQALGAIGTTEALAAVQRHAKRSLSKPEKAFAEKALAGH